MKECTLQEAVELCEKKKGRFRHIDSDIWLTISNSGTIISTESKCSYGFSVDDFRSIWIYEPPQKSAFQEWSSITDFQYRCDLRDLVDRSRKEGWNAFAERFESGIDLCIGNGGKNIAFSKLKQEIEKLKEP